MVVDQNARFAQSHEWVRTDGDVLVCGISDYAQDSLGDVVFVELPAVGETLKKGAPFGVVESVKAASDVYMPVSGEIVEVNAVLSNDPAVVNQSPFGEGWLIKIRGTNPAETAELMAAGDYDAYTKNL